MNIKDWKQFAPFYFYAAAAATLNFAAWLSEPRTLSSLLFWLVLGFISWSLVEYILHRFLFHHEARSERSRSFIYALHLSHHDDPQGSDHLFVRLWMSLPIALCYGLLMWALVGDWHSTAYLFGGLIAGYFSYEWVHYQAHHGRPRLRLLRYLKRYHLLHHHRTPGLRFGVTSPVIDYLFGTFQQMSKGASPAREHIA